jgi:hypothetical protein
MINIENYITALYFDKIMKDDEFLIRIDRKQMEGGLE